MKFKNEWRLLAAKTDEAVAVEIRHRLRLAEFLDVTVGGIGMIVDGEQAPLDQVRLSRPPQPNGNVGLPHRQVQLVLGEDQLDADLGVKIKKFRDALGQPDATNPHSGGDLQFPGRSLAGLGDTLARSLKA